MWLPIMVHPMERNKQLCNSPSILIVIVTYNRLHKLRHTMDCIFHGLSVDDWECLVINNASSDGTEEYLDTIHEDRLKKIHLKKLRKI